MSNQYIFDIPIYRKKKDNFDAEIETHVTKCLFRTKLTPYSGEIDPPFRIIDPLTVPGKRLPFRRN